MPWFYVDDGFSDSKPVLNMPDRYRLAACGLWTLAGSWSAKEELDGFVPDSKLRQLGARPPIIAALTDSGPMSAPLCTEVDGGLQFNSWEKWQPTRAELVAERIENERKREADAERKRAERAAKNDQNPDRPRRRRKGRNTVISTNPTDENLPSSQCPNGQTADIQRDSRAHAGARLDPTRPDPTRPDLETHQSVYPTVSSAPPHTDQPPSKFCDNHPDGTRDRCGDCANARRAFEAWEAAQTEHDREAAERADADRSAIRAAIDNCGNCDDFGRLDDLSPCPDHPNFGEGRRAHG